MNCSTIPLGKPQKPDKKKVPLKQRKKEWHTNLKEPKDQETTTETVEVKALTIQKQERIKLKGKQQVAYGDKDTSGHTTKIKDVEKYLEANIIKSFRIKEREEPTKSNARGTQASLQPP